MDLDATGINVRYVEDGKDSEGRGGGQGHANRSRNGISVSYIGRRKPTLQSVHRVAKWGRSAIRSTGFRTIWVVACVSIVDRNTLVPVHFISGKKRGATASTDRLHGFPL